MKVSKLSEVEKLRETIQNAEQQFSEIEIKIQQMRENLHTKFKTVLEKHQISQIDEEFLESFFEEPYVMIPKRGHEWYVIVPKWLNMQVGYLEHSTKSYNIFIVNKYVQWLSEIPETLREKLKFPKPLPIKIFDGMLLTGSELQNQVFEKYRDYVTSRSGKDRIKIKPGYEFKLIAQLIEEGTLPFMMTPIVEEDMRPWTGLGKEAYDKICREKNILDIQEKAWNEFKQRGAMGIFWAFGTGKSLFGHRLIGQIKGDKLVVVPTLTLKDQWLERLKTFNPISLNEVKVETYHAYEKVRALPRKLVIFDECLPYETKVDTEKGQTQIGDIVEQFDVFKNLRIWSYDVQNANLELKPITHRFKKESFELMYITTESGNDMSLTPTHKVYLTNGDYLPVGDLEIGQQILCLRNMQQNFQQFPFIKRSQNASQTSRTQQDDCTELPLEQTVTPEMGGIQEAIGKEAFTQWKSSLERRQPYGYMAEDSVRRFKPTKDLHRLPRQIRRYPIGHPSQRRESSQQFQRKHSNSMQELSHKLTQGRWGLYTQVDRIRTVEHVTLKATTVYDIEVADNHNFFANGILVSNCQHLPANTYIRLSTIPAKYRVGFSGSPFREDGRENYIIALTGFPLGMAWEDLLRLQIIQAPQFRVYIVENKREKDKKLAELLQIPIKTIIFSDSLDYGEEISKTFEIPFVYGETKDRLSIISNAQTCVVSRVGDEGLSIPDLERVIEVAFLFGSRMQESQRFGRLMHSSKKTQHVIIMTREEFNLYQKRLQAILERGFKIEYVNA